MMQDDEPAPTAAAAAAPAPVAGRAPPSGPAEVRAPSAIFLSDSELLKMQSATDDGEVSD
jgi:hypothetical protein